MAAPSTDPMHTISKQIVIRSVFRVIAALALQAIGFATDFGQTANRASITGRVLNADSGAYLYNAQIPVIESPEGARNLQTSTDNKGYFRSKQLPSGRILMQVVYTGHTSAEFSVPVNAGGFENVL